MNQQASERVLVTGATGFVGHHLVLRLLREGFTVRAAVRNLILGEQLKRRLGDIEPAAHNIELVRLELEDETGWVEAMHDVNYVHHLASPLPFKLPNDKDALIAPTMNGFMRVLNAARNEIGMKRVVVTSSAAAVTFGWRNYRPDPLDETHWTDPDCLSRNTAHSRAASIAERAAWDWVQSDGDGLSMTTILPAVTLGPMMAPRLPASARLIQGLMSRPLPALPRVGVIVSDARDVADAHFAAMTSPRADGRRFLVGDAFLTIKDICEVLAETFPAHASRFNRPVAPDMLVRAARGFWPGLNHFLIELGKVRTISTERLQNDLGITPRPARQSIKDTARSLETHKLVSLPG